MNFTHHLIFVTFVGSLSHTQLGHHAKQAAWLVTGWAPVAYWVELLWGYVSYSRGVVFNPKEHVKSKDSNLIRQSVSKNTLSFYKLY